MHDIASEINSIDASIAASSDLLGAECLTCRRLLAYKYFRRSTSRKTGHVDQCMDCEDQPLLSMEEHVSRLQGMNYNSHAVRAQRHEDQEEFRKNRVGRSMLASDLLLKLQRLVPNLFVKEAGIFGNVALYLTSPGIRADWDGKNYKYMGFVPFTLLPEMSSYEFDDSRDVMIREDEKGWRNVLLGFIRSGILTSEQCDKEFGKAVGSHTDLWFKRIQQYKTFKNQAPQQ